MLGLFAHPPQKKDMAGYCMGPGERRNNYGRLLITVPILPNTQPQLGARTIGNANLTGRNYEELTTLKLLSVFFEHRIEVFNFGLQSSAWKPKENDAGVQTESGRLCPCMPFSPPDVLLGEWQQRWRRGCLPLPQLSDNALNRP
jgi:hypothetical protein